MSWQVCTPPGGASHKRCICCLAACPACSTLQACPASASGCYCTVVFLSHHLPRPSCMRGRHCSALSTQGGQDRCCAQVLAALPAPLPGLEGPDSLLPLLSWASQLLSSPKIVEADAGDGQHVSPASSRLSLLLSLLMLCSHSCFRAERPKTPASRAARQAETTHGLDASCVQVHAR